MKKTDSKTKAPKGKIHILIIGMPGKKLGKQGAKRSEKSA
jgi:hypothetical protein